MATTDAHLNSLGMSGDYNKHSAPQRVALSHTFPALQEAVEKICSKKTFAPSDSFTIADYGSSHGGNSLKPMSVVIDAVRKHANEDQTIAIYHTDLPHNDYNKLFVTLHESEESYTKFASPNAPILTFATATPFFQQILPSSSVHLGFSSSAVHWISGFPCDTQNLYSVEAPESERSLWRQQAAVDWKNFLRARSAELVPGGMMVLSNLFMEDSGDYTTKELGIVMDTVIAEMVEKNMVDAQAARRFTHPSYFRTHEEYVSPLPEHGFTLHDSFSRHIPNPIYVECEQSGDWSQFGKSMVEWAKQWVQVALLRVVSQLADDADRMHAIQYFYDRVAEEVAAKPQDHKSLMVMLYLIIEKNSPAYRLTQ